MSSDSQPSSIDSPPKNNPLDRIWNSIQQTKTLSQMLDKHPTPQHRQYRQNVQLEMSPFEGIQGKQNLAHMARKVHKLEEQVRMLNFKLEEQRYAHESEVASIRRQYEHRLKSQLKKIRNSQKENVSYQKQNYQMEKISRENEKLALRLKSMELEVKSCQEERKKIAQLNDLYVQKLSEGRMGVGQLGQGQQLLELQQATRTVCRLVELLRRTQEYREFAPLMQEVGDMHYLRNILKRLKLNQLNYRPIDKKMCSCRGLKVSQKLLWSPVECYKVMLSMKMKYDFLSQDCIEEVLFELNRLYSSKEQKVIAKLKQNYEQQINKIRKQMQHSYDQVLTKKQVSRLKKQLSAVKSAHKARMPPKIEHFKDKGQLADQLKLNQKEIKLLRQRIKLFESENGFQDKSLYYEGTLSALDKVLAQLENNEANMKQFEMKFRQRVEDNMEPEDWLSSYKQFFETLEELGGSLVERVLALKEGVLRKMGKIE